MDVRHTMMTLWSREGESCKSVNPEWELAILHERMTGVASLGACST